jgi:hypothetical protein
MKFLLFLIMLCLWSVIFVLYIRRKISITNMLLLTISIIIGYSFIHCQYTLAQCSEKIAHHLQRIADEETGINSFAQESAERAMQAKREAESLKNIFDDSHK